MPYGSICKQTIIFLKGGFLLNREIFLSKKVTENAVLTDDGFLVYVALRSKWYFDDKHFTEDYIHYDELLWILTESTEHSKTYIEKIKNGTQNLEALGLIQQLKQCSGGEIIQFNKSYYFNAKSESKQFENYVVIYLSEVRTIMSSQEKFRDKLLRYFTAKIGSIYHGEDKLPFAGNPGAYLTDSVGAMPISHCADMAHIREKAALHYDRWLENNHLLVILRSNSKILDDDRRIIINGFPNCYARPADIDKLRKYYIQRERDISNSNVIQTSQKANRRRSEKQTFHAFCKGRSFDPQKLLSYFNMQLKNYEIIRANLNRKKQTNDNWNCYMENEQAIDEIRSNISKLVWEMYLDDIIDLQLPASS